MFKKILLIFSLCSISPLPALAASPKATTTPVAKTQVNLAYSNGVTLSWLQTNSIIKKIWLDNPTFAVMDFDGCVAGFNGCSESNAQIIHLKRIEDLKLKGIPAASKTLLTVISENNQGKRELHFFEIVKSATASQTLVEIQPPPTPKPSILPAPTITATGLPVHEIADKIRSTIRQPHIQAQIELPVRDKLIRLASLLQAGTPEIQALNQSGVSPKLLRQIINYKN